MTYAVKEIYYTLQGEGIHTGRPAVFVRFAGCNLWSGRNEDRETAVCNFCDTDFLGGERMTAGDIATACVGAVPYRPKQQVLVLTGGEPALQYDEELREALKRAGFCPHIETNGTIALKAPVDWLTMSPKAGTDIVVTNGNELKLVYPQPGLMPERVEAMDLWFDYWLLQPMTPTTRMFAEDHRRDRNTQLAIEYVKKNPQWRLSTQSHKDWRIP